MCQCQVTLRHSSALEKVYSTLQKEKTFRGARDGDTEEVVQINEVRHGELKVKTYRNHFSCGWPPTTNLLFSLLIGIIPGQIQQPLRIFEAYLLHCERPLSGGWRPSNQR